MGEKAGVMICEPRGYDDEELIGLLAGGRASYQQIAQQVGIEARTVAAIARGSERPELQEEVERASVEMVRQVRRLARSYARNLLNAHLTEAIKGQGEPARKAREFLLDRLLTRDPGGEGPAAGETRLPGLTREEMEYLADKRQGPRD
ncbi:MAG: hypothetical protein NTV86_17820 [Planctomycetota bacterium]|nr:hypothetical protein [Planctomycetota bacterium]